MILRVPTTQDFVDVVALVGLPLSGKTTLGAALAKALKWPHIDLDNLIETQEKKPIYALLRAHTETTFRAIEARALRLCVEKKKPPFVLSLGGGTPCFNEHMRLLRQKGFFTIHLALSWADLQARLRHTDLCGRPLLWQIAKGKLPTIPQLKARFEDRLAHYQKAHVSLNVETKSITELTKEVLFKLHHSAFKWNWWGERNF